MPRSRMDSSALVNKFTGQLYENRYSLRICAHTSVTGEAFNKSNSPDVECGDVKGIISHPNKQTSRLVTAGAIFSKSKSIRDRDVNKTEGIFIYLFQTPDRLGISPVQECINTPALLAVPRCTENLYRNPMRMKSSPGLNSPIGRTIYLPQDLRLNSYCHWWEVPSHGYNCNNRTSRKIVMPSLSPPVFTEGLPSNHTPEMLGNAEDELESGYLQKAIQPNLDGEAVNKAVTTSSGTFHKTSGFSKYQVLPTVTTGSVSLLVKSSISKLYEWIAFGFYRKGYNARMNSGGNENGGSSDQRSQGGGVYVQGIPPVHHIPPILQELLHSSYVHPSTPPPHTGTAAAAAAVRSASAANGSGGGDGSGGRRPGPGPTTSGSLLLHASYPLESIPARPHPRSGCSYLCLTLSWLTLLFGVLWRLPVGIVYFVLATFALVVRCILFIVLTLLAAGILVLFRGPVVAFRSFSFAHVSTWCKLTLERYGKHALYSLTFPLQGIRKNFNEEPSKCCTWFCMDLFMSGVMFCVIALPILYGLGVFHFAHRCHHNCVSTTDGGGGAR